MNTRTRTKILPAVLFAAFAAGNAAASGYHFGTQSVSTQGTANSSAAEAADAATIFYNPAGLAYLERNEISVSANLVAPSIRYSGAYAAHYRNGRPVSGSSSGKITDDITVAPHVYGAYRLNSRVSLGLGVSVPFGSSTEYDKSSVLRHNINKLGLKTVAVEPVIALKAGEKHAFAAGLAAQYSQAQLRKFADWSAGMSPAAPHTGSLLDGYADVKGHDWGFGYHLAWMYQPTDRLRIGLNYRSKVSHTLKGSAKWQAEGLLARANFQGISAPVVLGGRGYAASEKASVAINTPESLSLHGMYKATPRLNLFGDITWTRHSRFKRADLVFEQPKRIIGGGLSNTTTITPNWRNTVKAAVGGSYQISEPWQLRAGIAFDQSPVRNSASRMNTLPDGNRLWFSAGVRYTPNPAHTFDIAYTHVHINGSDFASPRATGTDVDSKGAATARFKNYANILGAQYTYKF